MEIRGMSMQVSPDVWSLQLRNCSSSARLREQSLRRQDTWVAAGTEILVAVSLALRVYMYSSSCGFFWQYWIRWFLNCCLLSIRVCILTIFLELATSDSSTDSFLLRGLLSLMSVDPDSYFFNLVSLACNFSFNDQILFWRTGCCFTWSRSLSICCQQLFFISSICEGISLDSCTMQYRLSRSCWMSLWNIEMSESPTLSSCPGSTRSNSPFSLHLTQWETS